MVLRSGQPPKGNSHSTASLKKMSSKFAKSDHLHLLSRAFIRKEYKKKEEDWVYIQLIANRDFTEEERPLLVSKDAAGAYCTFCKTFFNYNAAVNSSSICRHAKSCWQKEKPIVPFYPYSNPAAMNPAAMNPAAMNPAAMFGFGHSDPSLAFQALAENLRLLAQQPSQPPRGRQSRNSSESPPRRRYKRSRSRSRSRSPDRYHAERRRRSRWATCSDCIHHPNYETQMPKVHVRIRWLWKVHRRSYSLLIVNVSAVNLCMNYLL